MAAKITKIEIKIDDKTIKLNLAQAKELKLILADMFSEPSVTTIPYPVYIESPWKYWWTDTTAGTIYLTANDSKKFLSSTY